MFIWQVLYIYNLLYNTIFTIQRFQPGIPPLRPRGNGCIQHNNYIVLYKKITLYYIKITCTVIASTLAIASVLAKVLEFIILERIEMFVYTHENQFGFKKQHGTDTSIYVMKEIINRYQRLGSSVYLCCLDASKTFDRINHDTLFKKLVNRNVPAYIVRLLVVWYSHQQMFVKWGNVMSSVFTVSKGVRQGGVLSPYLFNVYVDGLSEMLNTCRTGCYSGVSKVNHLMYADYLVLLSPCKIGLSRLLKCCDDYAVSHDIVYNGSKRCVLICSPNKTVSTDPVFRIHNNLIVRKPKVKYLGHIISEDMSDDADVFRQVKCLYIRGNNIISRKFANCSINVKLVVFKTYCSCLYTSQLWGTCLSRTMNRLKVAYNDSQPLNIYSFMKRIQCMNNEMVHSIVHSDLIFSSLLWLNWSRRLFFVSNS